MPQPITNPPPTSPTTVANRPIDVSAAGPYVVAETYNLLVSGSATDPDIVQGRPYAPPPPKPEVKPGEEPPPEGELPEFVRQLLPPPEARPRTVLRFAEEKELLVSGMLGGGRELANRPAVLDVPAGKGHVLVFANNPMWRQQTQGSFFLVFNAAMNYEHLGVGRARPPAEAKPTADDDNVY